MPINREALIAQMSGLSDQELEALANIIEALTAPISADWTGPGWLPLAWEARFRSALRIHHAINANPLGREAFEDAFNTTCESLGWRVYPAKSATNRFYDTVVDNGVIRRLSLKATAAQRMREDVVHISKLTEAAWIQDARRKADRHRKLLSVFAEYRDTTDAIVLLRAMQHSGATRYQLLEISTELFASVPDLTAEQSQAGTIPLPPGSSTPVLKIRLDRSDAKITLTDIRLSACTVHGTWEITT